MERRGEHGKDPGGARNTEYARGPSSEAHPGIEAAHPGREAHPDGGGVSEVEELLLRIDGLDEEERLAVIAALSAVYARTGGVPDAEDRTVAHGRWARPALRRTFQASPGGWRSGLR